TYFLLKKAFEIRQDDKDFELNHTVLDKLKFDGEVFISPGTFSKRFGSWKQFIDQLGYDQYDQLENNLDEVIKKMLESQTL
ncbi:hypothetical protein K8I31_03175, partial [bacterium]|nr:hypothetical protein [bacterium]